MSIIERIQDLSSLPRQIRFQKEAYKAYRQTVQIPSRTTSDPILLDMPTFYEHRENTPLMSVIAVWQHLSGTSWSEWQATAGKQAISVLYALINDYDDFIDSPAARNQRLSSTEIQHGWRLGKASENRLPFREMVHDLLWTFDQMGLSVKEKQYMVKKLAFLKKVALEETVRWEYGNEAFSLQSAKIVRERTCRPFGELTAAVLNGKNCLTERGIETERTMGTWFIAAQVLEDLLDVEEDIRQHNLSFVTGALHDYPEELTNISNIVTRKSGRIPILQIKSMAPDTYHVVEKAFHEYLKQLPHDGKNQFLVATLRNTFYVLLPIKTMV
jgi:hypothetical protein